MLAEQLLRDWSQYIQLFSILNINMPYDDLFMVYKCTHFILFIYFCKKKTQEVKTVMKKSPLSFHFPQTAREGYSNAPNRLCDSIQG